MSQMGIFSNQASQAGSDRLDIMLRGFNTYPSSMSEFVNFLAIESRSGPLVFRVLNNTVDSIGASSCSDGTESSTGLVHCP